MNDENSKIGSLRGLPRHMRKINTLRSILTRSHEFIYVHNSTIHLKAQHDSNSLNSTSGILIKFKFVRSIVKGSTTKHNCLIVT